LVAISAVLEVMLTPLGTESSLPGVMSDQTKLFAADGAMIRGATTSKLLSALGHFGSIGFSILSRWCHQAGSHNRVAFLAIRIVLASYSGSVCK
jgi:hypothetical protein